MHLIKEYQRLINKGLNDIEFPEIPEKLYSPIRYFTDLGGKRIRPVLTLLAGEIFDFPIDKNLPLALAIEVFHNFTLLHDDLMDNSPLRRGKATVHEKWNPSIAILSGDAMLITAYQLLGKCDLQKYPELLSIFSTMAIEVCEGQQLDMDYEVQEAVTIEEYTNMIRLKTAILLGAALRLGAISSGASEADSLHLEQFGINIGIAFQLQDDFLDVYGETHTFGKKIGGDILANKKTFLMLSALRLAEGEKLEFLQKWIEEQDLPDEKIAAVTSLYDELGIPKLIIDEMHRYSKNAYEALDKVSVADLKKIPLRKLAESLLIRSS